MSFQPFNMDLLQGISKPIHDDVQYFDDYASILAEPDKSTQVQYVANDTGNFYTWNGVTLTLLVSGTGSVNSVTSGSSSIVITGTLNDPIINTAQAITTTATPTFANIISTNPATLFNHVVRKQELDAENTTYTPTFPLNWAVVPSNVEEALDTLKNDVVNLGVAESVVYNPLNPGDWGTLPFFVNEGLDILRTDLNSVSASVSSVTTANANRLSVDNTDPLNPILNSEIHTGEALRYKFTTGTTPASGQIAVNNGLNFAVTNQMRISYDAINRADNHYIKKFLDSLAFNSLPCQISLINHTNQTQNASFNLHFLIAIDPNYVEFNATYLPAQSTVTTFTNLLDLKVIIVPVNRTINITSGRLTSGVSYGVNPQLTLNTDAELNTMSSVGSGASLYKNKVGENFNIKSLVASHGINITNNTDDITLSSSLTLYLDGAVVVDNTGNLTLNGIAQTGSPYSITSSIQTIRSDVIINGSLTMNSNSSLICENDIVLLGSLNMNTNSSIACRGSFHCRGLSSADSLTVNSSNIISFDEISIRNYQTTGSIWFRQTAGNNNVDARSFVVDSNTSRILFDNGSNQHNITADSIIFSNNEYVSGGGTNYGMHFYDLKLNASVIKFNKNKTTGNYCIVFQDSQLLSANITEFNENELVAPVADGTADCIYFGNNNGISSSDKITFYRNRNNNAVLSNFASAVNFAPPCSLVSNTIEFIENDTGNANGWAVDIQGTTAVLKCETMQIVMTDGGGFFGTIRNGGDGTNLQGQYNTRRIPQYILNNNGSSFVGSWIGLQSYLGIQPVFETFFANYTTPTTINLITGGTHYKLVLASVTNLTNNSNVLSGSQFQQGATNGSIQYIGEDTALFEIDADLVLDVSNAGEDYSLILLVNDVLDPIHSNRTKHASANRPESWDLSKIIQLNKNDTVSLWFSNLTANTRTARIFLYQFSIKKLTIM